MPDLTLGGSRSYTLVTTTARRGPTGQIRFAQLDLHLISGDIRLRFADPVCVRVLSDALDQLHFDMTSPPELTDREVQTRVYSDETEPLLS